MSDQVVSKIDLFIQDIFGQSLIDSNKVIDFCLDIRQILQREVDESGISDSQ